MLVSMKYVSLVQKIMYNIPYVDDLPLLIFVCQSLYIIIIIIIVVFVIYYHYSSVSSSCCYYLLEIRGLYQSYLKHGTFRYDIRIRLRSMLHN